jgi:hypothetical protein
MWTSKVDIHIATMSLLYLSMMFAHNYSNCINIKSSQVYLFENEVVPGPPAEVKFELLYHQSNLKASYTLFMVVFTKVGHLYETHTNTFCIFVRTMCVCCVLYVQQPHGVPNNYENDHIIVVLCIVAHIPINN